MGVPKYRNQLTANVQELTDNNTVTGDLTSTYGNGTIVYTENQQGNNSLDTLDHRDSTYIVWTFHPKAEYTFLSFFIIYDSHRERESERGAETLAEGEAGSIHLEADVGFDPGSPGSRHRPKAGAKLLHHPGIPTHSFQLHMGHSTEQIIISWPTNQPSTGTTGTRRLISHPVHFCTTTLWNLKSTVRKKNWTDQKYVEIMNILLENEWSNQEIK